jgi:hypothetical protein
MFCQLYGTSDGRQRNVNYKKWDLTPARNHLYSDASLKRANLNKLIGPPAELKLNLPTLFRDKNVTPSARTTIIVI